MSELINRILVQSRFLVLWLLGASILTGCGYDKQSVRFMRPYLAGDISTASHEAELLAKEAGKGDRMIFLLEKGALLRAAGQLDASNKAFDEADAMREQFDSEPDVKLSQEAVAMVTDLSKLEYRGYGYDRIMLNVYKALNFMEIGDLENARVELRRAYERQRDAVRKNAERIEDADRLANQKPTKPDGVDVARSRNDPKFKQNLAKAYKDENATLKDYSAYAPYVNPLAEYLQGLNFLVNPADQSDRGAAVTILQRVNGMVSDKTYVAADLALAEQRDGATAGDFPSTTYVLFESGLAPDRVEYKIEIPVILVSQKLPYVGAAFPKLRYRPVDYTSITAQTSDGTYPSTLLCNMDAIMTREFKDELPTVITKTIIAAATKAAISYAVIEQTKKGSWERELASLGMFIAQAALNNADLRSWNTLPKQFHLIRIPTPQDRQLTLRLSNGLQTPAMTIGDGVVNVIVVKSVQPQLPLIIRQFKLK